MCTLAQFNQQFATGRDSEELKNVFCSLAQRDGMGIAALYRSGDEYHVEGIRGHDVSPEKITEWVLQHPRASWFTFHSRQATTAPRFRDDLCQPFIGEVLTMGHVGTIVELDKWSFEGSPVSDGFMVYELASKYSTRPLIDLYRAGLLPVAGFYRGVHFRIGAFHQYTCSSNGGVLYTSANISTPLRCAYSKTSGGIVLDGESYIREDEKGTFKDLYRDYKKSANMPTFKVPGDA